MATHLSVAIAGQARKRFVDRNDAILRIGDHNGLAAMFKDVGQQTQLFPRALLGIDIRGATANLRRGTIDARHEAKMNHVPAADAVTAKHSCLGNKDALAIALGNTGIDAAHQTLDVIPVQDLSGKPLDADRVGTDTIRARLQ